MIVKNIFFSSLIAVFSTAMAEDFKPITFNGCTFHEAPSDFFYFDNNGRSKKRFISMLDRKSFEVTIDDYLHGIKEVSFLTSDPDYKKEEGFLLSKTFKNKDIEARVYEYKQSKDDPISLRIVSIFGDNGVIQMNNLESKDVYSFLGSCYNNDFVENVADQVSIVNEAARKDIKEYFLNLSKS